jgi:hypothetical protein
MEGNSKDGLLSIRFDLRDFYMNECCRHIFDFCDILTIVAIKNKDKGIEDVCF